MIANITFRKFNANACLIEFKLFVFHSKYFFSAFLSICILYLITYPARKINILERRMNTSPIFFFDYE